VRILLSFLIGCFCLISCESQSSQQAASTNYQQIQGETMGTTYNINYADAQGRDFKPSVDSLLQVLNNEVSTYIPTSTISQFNQAQDSYNLGVDSVIIVKNEGEGAIYEKRQFFTDNYFLSRSVYEKTDGYFDPTVMPLVNYWGFGYTPKEPVTAVDSVKIDSLIAFVGMGNLEFSGEELVKTAPGVQLDFSAVAKGYGVDLIGLLLEERGVTDYMVEIGGEVRARGKNPKGEFWSIGVNTPVEYTSTSNLQVALLLDNKSVATSGNYRNFYEVEGVKYSHTINPKTGFPERNTLLSASVLADDCATADAYATACMVLGTERAFELVNSMDELEAYFIYSTSDGGMDVRFTEGMRERIKELNKANND